MLAQFLVLFQALVDRAHPPTTSPDAIDVPHTGDRQVVALREGYELVELPVAQERVVATHQFADVPSFSAWLLRYAHPLQTQIFADQTKGEIRAISTLDWSRDDVRCTLPRSQAWKDWSSAFGGACNQKNLYRFLLAHKAHLVGGDKVLQGLATLEVVGSSKYESRVNEKGVLEFTGSSAGRTISGSLPASFEIEIPAYLGQPELYRFTVDIDIDIADSGVPTFTLRASTLVDVALAAWVTELAKLEALLNGPEVEGPVPGEPPPIERWLVARGTLSVG